MKRDLDPLVREMFGRSRVTKRHRIGWWLVQAVGIVAAGFLAWLLTALAFLAG